MFFELTTIEIQLKSMSVVKQKLKIHFFFQTVHKYIFSCFPYEYNNRNHEVHFAKVRDSHQNMIRSDDIENWWVQLIIQYNTRNRVTA